MEFQRYFVSLFSELKRRNVFRVALAYAVVAWLLMQIGDTLAPALLLPEWTTRFLAFLLILGFPLALFFSWAFELTPEGLRPEKAVRREESVAPLTGRKLDVLIIALLAVAVAYFAWDKFAEPDDLVDAPVATTGPEPVRRSIAVLPFINMSGDAEQEYFSDGLSEELLNLLAKIPQLRVTSRSSSFSFKGKDYKIGDVGEQLGVSYVLEGSVRRSGDDIRITAQLIDVSSDAHLWSDTWDRPFLDVFAIQDEIAAAVTSALRIQLVDELPHAFVTDPRAYDLYLKARELVSAQNEAGVVEAEALLLELLEVDPTYSPGLVLLGEASTFLGLWGFRPMEESFQRAQNYGRLAIEAAPEFSAGYVLLSDLAVRYDRDWQQAERYIDEALRHDPADIDAQYQSTALHVREGRFEQRVKLAREMVRLDPLSGQSYWMLGHALMRTRQYDQSVAAFRKLLAISPDAAAGHAALGESLLLAGEHEEALAEFDAEPRDGFTHYGHAMTYFEMGEQANSDAAMNALLNLDDADDWAAQIAMAYAVRGEDSEAIAWLYRALELNDPGIHYAGGGFPFLDNLRGNPRYEEFINRVRAGGN